MQEQTRNNLLKAIANPIFLVILITGIGMLLRLYKIDFGLPQNFMADEPEFAELAIRYTYEIKSIIAHNDFYKLIPISYVYGTFPTYLFTAVTMLFSKSANILGIAFDKTTLYIMLRIVNATLASLIIPLTYFIAKDLFNRRAGILATLTVALNWKLIAHAHYINADTMITLLILGTICLLIRFFKEKDKTGYLYAAALLFGFAVGTKVTVLISLPALFYLFIAKKAPRELLGFCFIAAGAFMISNPFSFIFIQDFLLRIMAFQSKEAGLVFDSIDQNTFKYLSALEYILTLPALIIALYGVLSTVRAGVTKTHVFLFINIATYLVFFSLGERRVDRWLLPLIPLFAIYMGYGISTAVKKKPLSGYALAIILVLAHLIPTVALTEQYQESTPKGQAYYWLQQKMKITDTVFAVTEEGLDPLNKLNNSHVLQLNVYESEGAQYVYPPNPRCFDYVVLASKPLKSIQQNVVKMKFPFYAEKWSKFTNTVTNEKEFALQKEFVLSKPNYIELSDVFIYKRRGELPKECAIY